MNQRKAPSCASPFSLERLENRQLLSVAVNDDGWTEVGPSPDTRTVYVSSSAGNDTNNGLSSAAPVKTIAKAITLVRDGMPDWLLLKRGDTFSDGEGLGHWLKSGRSASEPMLISAYGSGERPLLKSGLYNGIYSAASSVSIIGLHFYANTRDPSSPEFISETQNNGITWSGGSNVLVEDCEIEGFSTNIIVMSDISPISNVSIRRSVVVDAYSSLYHSQGAFISAINGITLDGNVFDHNGWNEILPGAVPTKFNHNVYMAADNHGVVVKDNIFARASAWGLQARSGGEITGNLFLRNPMGMGFGHFAFAGGVEGRISGNVFSGPSTADGFAIEIANLKPTGNTIVSNNILAGDTSSTGPAIQIDGGKVGDGTNGINNLTIENNIIRGWRLPLYTDSRLLPGTTGPTALRNLIVRNNDFQKPLTDQIIFHMSAFDSRYETWSGNRYWADSNPSQWIGLGAYINSFDIWHLLADQSGVAMQVNYPDPTRTIASYSQTLELQSIDEFLLAARRQSKDNWRSDYTARASNSYMQRGFLITGDLNMDRDITIADFITLAAHFGQSDQDWTTGDLNGDGTVTVSDMIDLASNWGAVSRAAPNQLAMFAAAISLDANASTSPQDDPNQSSIISDSVDLASNWDILSTPESNNLGEEILASKLLTASTPKVIIRPVWFTYPRR